MATIGKKIVEILYIMAWQTVMPFTIIIAVTIFYYGQQCFGHFSVNIQLAVYSANFPCVFCLLLSG